MRHSNALALSLAGALAGLALAQAPAGAAAVGCGDTVTTDVRLTRNLTCAGDGLVVAAPGITVDLAGHRLSGSGGGTGIDLTGGHDGVTVRGGRVAGFGSGLDNLGGTRVEGVTFTGNGYGAVARGGRLEVVGSTFRDNQTGMGGVGTMDVTGSAFRGNERGIQCYNAELDVRGSAFTQNLQGMTTSLCGVVLEQSTFRGGQVAATFEPLGFGLELRGNTFAGAGLGVRVRQAFEGPRDISGNLFQGNGASGLVVESDAAHTSPGLVVRGNTFRANGSAPGAHTDASGRPLTSGAWVDAGEVAANLAVGNAGHGLEAHGAATDGGGNVARGNGARPQCVGVVCTTR
ncbi:hypothetical protein [Nocardioides solisilvae]|uniref:hypothetical protein n=1 Tax=Nocardioides solisilvae TaxID=1542435 RepID=UPI0013A57BD7|nr:hypothetical protein [Nocardioides solisilvae]